jgi:hypothetical protein
MDFITLGLTALSFSLMTALISPLFATWTRHAGLTLDSPLELSRMDMPQTWTHGENSVLFPPRTRRACSPSYAGYLFIALGLSVTQTRHDLLAFAAQTPPRAAFATLGP